MGVMLKLSFIVPTIDRKDSLLDCLASVAAQRYPAVEMIVVDDDSKDGSREAVLDEFPDTHYILNPSRVGIGPALAMGARAADGEVYVNLDDDGFLATTDSAARIAEYFETQPDLGAVAFKVEAPDGTVRHREIPLRSKRLPQADTDIAYFLGGAVALRASAIEAIGGYPDVEYYAWEQDVAYRLLKAGYRVMFAPAIRFTHLAIPSFQNVTGREAGYVRIHLRLAATYLPTPYAQIHALIWTAFCLARSVRNRELLVTWRATVAGFLDGRALRADRTHRLSLAEARRMTRLSGRTWF